MNYEDVQLIGVFDDKGEVESFVYSVDLPAPANLWVGALCSDGSRMHPMFMGFVLNALIAEDAWNEGDTTIVVDQSDVAMRCRVGDLVPKRSVEAFASQTDEVRVVTVDVLP
jgi:hypothetical protein